MFTGIITHLGRITAVSDEPDGRRLEIGADLDLDRLALGASVAHSGVCLTVTEKTGTGYSVYASAETLARTTMGGWRMGDRVNLEGSLRLGDELGGHLVFGHVDGIGRITGLAPVGESWRLEIELPEALRPLVAVKGSVSVDGISLTVNEVTRTTMALMIIPHTWGATTLHERKLGDAVNLEADMLARYVARQLAFKAAPLAVQEGAA
jgi:riboflavin synthase